MIKKISAILLALVLCFSVVVVPASAYELASGSEIAYVVELDKDYYSKGEMATVNVYLYGKEGLEFGTGAILIAMNSAVFDMSENVVADIKDTSTSGDAMASWYKDFTSASISWLTQATVLNNVKNSNTAEENAMYDQYLKIGLAKNTSGSHANIGSNKNGLPAEDINADSEAGIPFFSFQLKVKDDVEDGTAINVGITSGSMAKTQTYVNYYKNPGAATTVVKTTAATSEVVSSTNAKVGEPAPQVPELTVKYMGRDQIRFQKAADGSYAGKFDYRILAELDNFDEVFASIDDAKASIKDVGFVFNKGAAIDMAAAKAQVEGGAVTYSQVKNIYVSTSFVAGKYVIACTVYNIADADKTTALSALAYVVYEQDGVTKYAYFDAVQTSNFEGLYNTYYGQAFPA